MSIAYAFQPRLRLDLPWADEPSPGNLRFTADKILTCLFVTHANILTSESSTRLYNLTSTYNGTLCYHYMPEGI